MHRTHTQIDNFQMKCNWTAPTTKVRLLINVSTSYMWYVFDRMFGKRRCFVAIIWYHKFCLSRHVVQMRISLKQQPVLVHTLTKSKVQRQSSAEVTRTLYKPLHIRCSPSHHMRSSIIWICMNASTILYRSETNFPACISARRVLNFLDSTTKSTVSYPPSTSLFVSYICAKGVFAIYFQGVPTEFTAKVIAECLPKTCANPTNPLFTLLQTELQWAMKLHSRESQHTYPKAQQIRTYSSFFAFHILLILQL